MRALVLGGGGLVGHSLVPALTRAGHEVLAPSHQELDALDGSALARAVDRFEPDRIFNLIAYTQVDQAEDEPEAAFRLNAELPRILARATSPSGPGIVHFSTDFVFDGQGRAPYREDAPTAPVSVYARSKMGGETALLETARDRTTIIRTAWLFGPGKINFVAKILGLAAQREALTVVNDQTGSPTYTPDLAENAVALAETGAVGVFHLVGGGIATWYDLAAAAVRLAGLPCRVSPVTTDKFPTKAARPAYSVLATDKFTQATGRTPRAWTEALAEYVDALKQTPAA